MQAILIFVLVVLLLAAWDDWTAVDPESGMPHLWHIATNASFLMQYMEEGKTNEKM